MSAKRGPFPLFGPRKSHPLRFVVFFSSNISPTHLASRGHAPSGAARAKRAAFACERPLLCESARPVSGVGLGPSYYPASLLWSCGLRLFVIIKRIYLSLKTYLSVSSAASPGACPSCGVPWARSASPVLPKYRPLREESSI